MKKLIFFTLLWQCTFLQRASAQTSSGGIMRQKSEEAGMFLTKQNWVNHVNKVPDEFAQYFNWNANQYIILLNNDIFSYYEEHIRGERKYWSEDDIKAILSNDDSLIILPASDFVGCWETCGMKVVNGQAKFKWDSRNARSIANGDAKINEMFVCIRLKRFGGKILPIFSLNCGNGVRLKKSCLQKIVYEQPDPQEELEEDEDVADEEPEEEYEENIVVHHVKTTHVYEYEVVDQRQQAPCCPQQNYQQPMYQNPPQNRLTYNYYGGGNNAGWVNSGYQAPSNYSNSQSWSNNQSATSNNVNDNSNVFNNNTNVSYTSKPRPNTSNPYNYGTGSPAGVPGGNGFTWNGPGGVPPSGNNGGPVGVPGNGGFGSGGPSGAGGSGGRLTFH